MTAQLYLIQEGDTLASIAQQVCGDASLVSAIAAYNHIDNPAFILAGTTLIIDCEALRSWDPSQPPPIPGPNADGSFG